MKIEEGFDVMASGGAISTLSSQWADEDKSQAGAGESLKEGPLAVFPFPKKNIGF